MSTSISAKSCPKSGEPIPAEGTVKAIAWRPWLILTILAGALALAGLISWMVRQVKPNPPVAAGRRIELRGATNQAHGRPGYFAISTVTPFLPEESFLATLRYSDGYVRDGGVYAATWRCFGTNERSMNFSWQLPETVDADQLDVAAAALFRWDGRTIFMRAGEPISLFHATNRSGEAIAGTLEYIIEPAFVSTSTVAAIRVVESKAMTTYTPKFGWDDVVTASFYHAVPSGHRLECIGLTLDNLEETTRITSYISGRSNIRGCQWHFPTTFTTNDHQEAARQLQGATFLIRPKERVLAFAVTNQARDVFRGYLELVPPSNAK